MISIKDYVKETKYNLAQEMIGLLSRHKQNPKLVVIQVGQDPASMAYVAGKEKDCKELGIDFEIIRFDEETVTDYDVCIKISELNNDDSVHGIIVQLPLPDKLNKDLILQRISNIKDVDGFRKDSICKPCTPSGIMMWLDANKYDLSGKFATIIGRSDIVGKPLVQMMIERGATVTCCNSKTGDSKMKTLIAMSDIVVTAIDKMGYFDTEFDFSHCDIVVDVGICRSLEDGKLHGNVSPSVIENHPMTYITPVPGGVGLLTRLALIRNVLNAFIYQKTYLRFLK